MGSLNMIRFPHDFFWGAATSAYQVEGNNSNSDWWEWEKKVSQSEPSGRACRHYEFYRQDFDLAKNLQHNCHRLSVEWSRIEPEEGKFSKEAIGHYREIVNALIERGLEPIVTLHHFTNPIWFSRLGGWENKKSKEYFLRYAGGIIEALSDKVNYWVTINEPLVYVYHAYILGVWPPQEKSFQKARKVSCNLAFSHIEAYKLIHSIYKKRNLSPPKVSLAKNLQAFVPCIPTLRNKLATYLRERNFNFAFLDTLTKHKSLDFIGINYYTRSLVEVEKWRVRNLLLDICKNNHSQLKKNSLGWDIYPEGLYNLLLKLKRYNLPIFILENGICTDNDALRWDFIREHLKTMHLAMAGGVKVMGYIYWSLMDNFEWDKGFIPRFGLIDINYQNYQRTVRESARKFAEVCKTGMID
jgi:beta-glucosidase